MMKVFFLCLACFWACFGFGQSNSVFLDQYSLEEGLSQSGVNCLLKDQQGYIWLGTQNGLNRFDGHQFVTYQHQPFQANSLSNEFILSFCEDRQGHLWVGTRQGLNRFDRINGIITRYGTSYKLTVNALVEDRDGSLWIGTPNGLFRMKSTASPELDFQNLVSSSDYLLKDRVIYTLHRDSQGFLWAGTSQGLYRISPVEKGIRRVIHWSLPHTPVYSIVQDATYRLWVGTEVGLHQISTQKPGSVQRFLPTQQPVLALLVSHKSVLWVSVRNEGIYRYDLQDPTLPLLSHWTGNAKKGLQSNVVTSLYQGPDPKEDVIWLGTRDAGVQVFSQAKNSFRHWEDLITPPGSLQSFFSLYTDRHHNLWAGTYRGLFCINQHTLESQHFSEKLLGERIYSILEDYKGTLWVGSSKGLYRWSGSQFVSDPAYREFPMVSKLYEDRHHQLWIGTGKALYKRNRAGQLTRFEFSSKGPESTIEAIQEMPDGTLWVGTMGGLNRIDTNGRITPYYNQTDDPESLLSNEIYDLHCDRKGQLWVTSSKGLSRLFFRDGQPRFEHFTEQDGLANHVVYGMLEDQEGRFWMSTNRGLSRFDPRTQTFRNYSSRDGLMANEFNTGAFHRSADGTFFFGGIGLLVSFNPQELTESRFTPPVVLTSFRKFEKPFAFDSLLAHDHQLTIQANENFFSFVYNTLDYSSPQKNQYAYLLEGFQTNWNFSGTRRYISFSNLSPGTYTLKVKASNADGLWNDSQILQIPIVVVPPFWQRWWFYVICLLVVGGTAQLIYQSRVRRQVAHLLELEKVKLVENERVRKLAAQDLHDEFGNTITRISMLTEIIKARLPEPSAEVLPLLTKISDNANRMYQGTKDFIWAINPDHDNLYEIAIRLKDFGDDVLDKTGIRFDINGLDESLRNYVLPMGMSRHLIFLFKEAISNTLKHAQATQTFLAFERQGDEATIRWIDNGQGFDARKSRKGNGLLNMESRARKFEGIFTLESTPAQGTVVSVCIRLPQKKPTVSK
ncbi:sensor histidine kinase [Siphonobacter curvatus]|uniref:Histidine kinase/HSP90-like ATPase domain-containing protein n=1 Tax=Siphonobacter curvatus TaxID=2094562 RepID=A0A2S7INC9_9BACT|nr:sensor histidine kinase [Siphonobacter curvatus]PQA59234.1 hypothetical protein C5O19_06160 [Siphonobacter curvatus]